MSKLRSTFLFFAFLVIVVKESYGNLRLDLGTEIVATSFTPFKKNFDLNDALITKMAEKYYRDKVKAILVGGYAGEGPSMDLCTRKKLANAWVRAAVPRGIKVMVDVGAIAFVDMLKLVKFCAEIEVTAIFVLPEIIYKARTVDEVIRDLKIIARVAPNLRMIFQDLQFLTGPFVNIIEVYKRALEVPTFAGISTTLDKAIELKRVLGPKPDKLIIVTGNDVNAPLALKVGIHISLWINVYPNLAWRIVDAINAGDCDRAADLQTEFNDRILCSIDTRGDNTTESYTSRAYIENQKYVYTLVTGWNLRQRLPLVETDASEASRIRSCLVNLDLPELKIGRGDRYNRYTGIDYNDSDKVYTYNDE